MTTIDNINVFATREEAEAELASRGGSYGFGEVLFDGEYSRATLAAMFRGDIIDEADMDAEIDRRAAEETEIFGDSRPRSELRAQIERHNARLQAMIEAAPAKAVQAWRVCI